MFKKDCRCCEGFNLKSVIDFGNIPLANNLLNNFLEDDLAFPLELMYCQDCHNCQLSYSVDSKVMFDNYLYVSSTTEQMRNHFKRAAYSVAKDFNLDENSVVVEIGSNDGVFLTHLNDKNIKICGIEPAKNISAIANDKGLHTYNGYCDKEAVNYVLSNFGKADVVAAFNVFAHADNLKLILDSAFEMLKDDGVFIVENQWLLKTMFDLTFDNIYHEHFNYWSVTSMNNFVQRNGYHIQKVERHTTHGGSIRVHISRKPTKCDSLNSFLELEYCHGLTSFDAYERFAEKIKECKKNTLKAFDELNCKYGKVAGYGSPAKATTLLNYFGIDHNYLSFIIEDNPLKYEKIVPGIKVKIINKDLANIVTPRAIVVLAWNFYDEIIKNNKAFIDNGIEFLNIKDLQNG
jgi:SAM-dependent methyltransferase